MRSQPRCPIVVADDDAADRYLIQQAFEDSGVEGEVHFLEDGQPSRSVTPASSIS